MSFLMRQAFFILLLTGISSISLQAQTPLKEAKRDTEVPAAWPGCEPTGDCTHTKLDEFIAQNLVTPAEAKAHGAGGVVLVEFVIEKNGLIGEIKTFHDPGFGLGTAAYNVIKLMKDKKIKWEPAEDKGKRVASRFMAPISFNLALPPKKEPETTAAKEVVPDVYDVVEVMPLYSGCVSSPSDTIDCTFIQMVRHIQTNLQYPDTALAAGAQGPVVVQFVIDSKGNITQPVVTLGLGYGCDEEALRVISLMPAWQPGLQGGQPVPVRMVVPILFQLPKEDKE